MRHTPVSFCEKHEINGGGGGGGGEGGTVGTYFAHKQRNTT